MKSLLCLSTLFLAAVPSRAAIVLIVDITNPSAVTFTATGAFSQNDESYHTLGDDGITLQNFFSSPTVNGNGDPAALYGALTSSDLQAYNAPYPTRPSTETPVYTHFYSIDWNLQSDGSNRVDLNLLLPSSWDDQTFSTTSPALSGSATADLSPWISQISLGGGNIRGDGRYFQSGIIIGQYVVIPEPATSLLAIGALGMLAIRRRR